MSLDSRKILGPNGFNVEFYKFFWYDIQNELCDVIQYFFERAHMPTSWGLTYIALIPKKILPQDCF